MDDGGGCNPGAGKTGRRVSEDVVHGDVVVGVDDAVVVVQIRAVPEQVDGVREVHRRRKEEMPGEDPLFRQLPAGDTGEMLDY